MESNGVANGGYAQAELQRQQQQAAYFSQDVDDDEFIGDDGDVDLGIPEDYANGGFMDESGECNTLQCQLIAVPSS